jgi:hypothetical protein
MVHKQHCLSITLPVNIILLLPYVAHRVVTTTLDREVLVHFTSRTQAYVYFMDIRVIM